MVDALTLARLCQSLYNAEPVFDHVWTFSGTVVGHVRMGDVDVVTFRGSQNLLDAVLDIETLPIEDPAIGWIHSGMNVGMVEAISQVSLACGPRIVLNGHSLGGGRARNAAARFAHAGVPAMQLTVFEAPRSLMHDACQIIRDSATWHSSYRNMSSLIPLMPTVDPRWEHPDMYSELHADALPGDRDPLFRYHHISLIIVGLQMLGATEVQPQGVTL